MKLLIVDDSTLIRRSIERYAGYFDFQEIRSATNGFQAMTVFREFLPDVVTLDITMPEMDGLTCLEGLLDIKPDALVLIISALADKSTAVEALKRGATGFLLKPFTEATLIENIRDLLEE